VLFRFVFFFFFCVSKFFTFDISIHRHLTSTPDTVELVEGRGGQKADATVDVDRG